MAVTSEQAWDVFHLQMKHFIFKYTRDESMTEDILQDVFLKMHLHLAELKEDQKLQSWLYQIARNTMYDYVRRQKSTLSLTKAFDLPEEPAQEDVEQTLLPCIKEMVDNLPTLYREAIMLTEYHGLTQKELAEHLHLSLSGAKSRVQRARAKLKHALLECCHFVFDRRGKIIDYHRRDSCCVACACRS